MTRPAPLLLTAAEQHAAWNLLRRIGAGMGAPAGPEELEGLVPRGERPLDDLQQAYLAALCAAFIAGAQAAGHPAALQDAQVLLRRLA